MHSEVLVTLCIICSPKQVNGNCMKLEIIQDRDNNEFIISELHSLKKQVKTLQKELKRCLPDYLKERIWITITKSPHQHKRFPFLI